MSNINTVIKKLRANHIECSVIDNEEIDINGSIFTKDKITTSEISNNGNDILINGFTFTGSGPTINTVNTTQAYLKTINPHTSDPKVYFPSEVDFQSNINVLSVTTNNIMSSSSLTLTAPDINISGTLTMTSIKTNSITSINSSITIDSNTIVNGNLTSLDLNSTTGSITNLTTEKINSIIVDENSMSMTTLNAPNINTDIIIGTGNSTTINSVIMNNGYITCTGININSSINIDTINKNSGNVTVEGVSFLSGVVTGISSLTTSDIISTNITVDSINDITLNSGDITTTGIITSSVLKSNSLNTDIISELTPDAGISIDGITVKDNNIECDTITCNTINLDVGVGSSDHKDLLNIQGGLLDEYYHLSLSEYANLQTMLSGLLTEFNISGLSITKETNNYRIDVPNKLIISVAGVDKFETN